MGQYSTVIDTPSLKLRQPKRIFGVRLASLQPKERSLIPLIPSYCTWHCQIVSPIIWARVVKRRSQLAAALRTLATSNNSKSLEACCIFWYSPFDVSRVAAFKLGSNKSL